MMFGFKPDRQLIRALAKLIVQGEHMRAAIERLTREVSESRTVGASIIALVTGIAEQIRNTPADRAALDALANDLDDQQRVMSVAVTENTPTPTPPNPDEPPPVV